MASNSVDVVFAFHGFPGAVHQLIHGRPDTARFHIRGFIEQGTAQWLGGVVIFRVLEVDPVRPLRIVSSAANVVIG